MKKLKIAIIGCGRISYKHIEAIDQNKVEIQLIALCDRVEYKAITKRDECIKALGEDADVKVYIDYKEMLEKIDVDLVSIATESGHHSEIAIYCMNKGKHVIVEKPMALSNQDADKMIECAKKNNVKLCVNYQNRFNEPIQKLRTAVEENRFGKLVNGTARTLWNRSRGYYEEASWRGTWELDGGTLMNQCIHNIDLLQWMMGGEIDTVYAQCGTFLRDIEGEDFGAIIIRFKNGAIGIIEGSACVYPKNIEETLSIFGETGTVSIGGLAVNLIETWRFKDDKDTEEEILKKYQRESDTVYGSGHILLFKNMIDAINMDREPLINGEEGKKSMSIVLAAYKSRLTGLQIKFPMGDFSTSEMKK